MSLIEDLRKIEVFQDQPEEQLAWLAQQATEIRLEPGESLFEMGAPADRLFVFFEGEVEMRRDGYSLVYIGAGDVSGLLPVAVTVVEKPPAMQRLLLSGLVGTVVLGLTAMMVAASLLAGAGAVPSWQRYGRQLSAATWIFLLASALLALQRLLYLGDA